MIKCGAFLFGFFASVLNLIFELRKKFMLAHTFVFKMKKKGSLCAYLLLLPSLFYFIICDQCLLVLKWQFLVSPQFQIGGFKAISISKRKAGFCLSWHRTFLSITS